MKVFTLNDPYDIMGFYKTYKKHTRYHTAMHGQFYYVL